MNQATVNSLMKFVLRRGLTILGGSAATISDDQLTQVVSFVLIVSNEAYQAWQAHQHEKAKAEIVKVS